MTKRPRSPRPTFLIRVRPEPGVDAVCALRKFLKRLLRSAGLRALSVEQERR
jgi:hypothetical protein